MKKRAKASVMCCGMATVLSVASCATESGVTNHTISGHVVGETASTFTILSDGNLTTLPKNQSLVNEDRIFMEDSIVVSYTDSAGNVMVSDVILISHASSLNNVAELFVGSWNDADSAENITFNADLTTSSNMRWAVRGRKMFIQSGDTAQEYDIVSIDHSHMELCYEDRRIRYSRVRN